ncbi:uncharacterized protein [Nicotiana sylvestris]|uniref:uncharacterized protein n=1 Tax=Nicotiana sylvestris TaxID=4096 RepID=UPI00388CE181
MASYPRCLVTEEYQAKMDAVEVGYLFNEAHHALNRLLSETLQVELVAAQDEHAEMAEQRLEQIKDLQRQINEVRDEAEKFKGCMDMLASKKEAIQAEMESAKSQLQVVRENASVQAKIAEDLESNLASLAKELEVARSEVAVANTKAQSTATQYKVNAEATLEEAKGMVDHSKWQARREAPEGVLAQSFDISVELEIAKIEE